MGQNINTVVITGNLTRDPELKQVGELSICELSVALNSREKRQGEWEDRVDYFDVTVFGGLADNCAKYLSKGKPVAVSGRLRQDRWTDKETQTARSKIKIVATGVQFLESRSEQDREASTERDAAADPTGEYKGMVGKDDDIPF